MGVVVADADEVDAVVVSDAVVVASVVVAVKAATMPVLKIPIITRLIMRTLAAENKSVVFMYLADARHLEATLRRPADRKAAYPRASGGWLRPGAARKIR